MTREFPRPKVFSSRCLGFEACRWNGVTIHDDFIERLKPHVDFLTVCPEVAIGMGVPRQPIRIVSAKGKVRLMQPATGEDLTDRMNIFARDLLGSIGEVDGFILKDRSPSCGIGNVKVYPGLKPSSASDKASGFFGAAVIQRFGHLPIETEERLTNYRIREHFLARLFTLARFRQVKAARSIRDLINFHSNHKLLLMSYSQRELVVMGKAVANLEKRGLDALFSEYEEHLHRALAHVPRYASNINILIGRI